METATPTFGPDWTSHHFPDWQRWLGHLTGRPAAGLEIGSFEGRSALWFVEHVLTNPESRLLCIDPYCYADEHAIVPGGGTYIDKQFDFAKIRQTFEQNLAPWLAAGCVTLDARPSSTVLRSQPLQESYDFAYIDGSHLASAALEDAILVWPLIRPGGIMICDDYGWTQSKPGPWGDPALMQPTIGVDAFLFVYRGRYDEVEQSQGQMKVRKIS